MNSDFSMPKAYNLKNATLEYQDGISILKYFAKIIEINFNYLTHFEDTTINSCLFD